MTRLTDITAAEVAAPIGLEQLQAATAGFFERHWKEAVLGAPPQWQSWTTFLDGPVPGYRFGGCYALFEGTHLTYVGLGASRGGGRYQQHGLSRRLMAHVYRSDRQRGPTALRLRENWAGTTALWTLPMSDHDYLAPAMESYLIRQLQPARNARV